MAVRRKNHVNHRRLPKSRSRFTPRRLAKTRSERARPEDSKPKNGAVQAQLETKPPAVDGAIVLGPTIAEEVVIAIARERGSYDGDTAIKLYLREIGQVKLLTPEEEVELAARIKRGDKKAREQMIKANLRLVVKIAH